MTVQTDDARVRLSIAMCTYNGAKYLPEQLESIRLQTRPPFELVVRDDGSTDHTLAILEEFARQASFPVRLTINKKNLHFTGNFLMAASQCSGDCVVFCDQDDIWEPSKLEEIEASVRLNQADLYLHEGLLINGAGVPQGMKLPDHVRWRANPEPFGHGAKGFAMAVSKPVIDEILQYWDWDYYADFKAKFGVPLGHDLLIDSWCVERNVVLMPKVLTRYRAHESNVTVPQAFTEGWLTKLVSSAKLIQFSNFNYASLAAKWGAEVDLIDHMFPHMPPGIRALRQYLGEMSKLWGARGAVHDRRKNRRQRLRALRHFWQINSTVRLASRFDRTAVAKDLVLTMLR